ncbi:WD40/YVTN/BNR-like repeat-containing protein [Streptomyces sp. NBC_00525]|uniref:WD40/YVTN/BNR-like repeat-containing protein n=1 Tax=Streptomyces sp. NBC_00525 TaxID=2903660 RepID=UPI002E81B01A|nr:1,4-beta-glucanase [Streptomyces sp. NBC_00525]WUC96980.1 1,4-beta-glucanase [Streptomyces sp. NBC_00525]
MRASSAPTPRRRTVLASAAVAAAATALPVAAPAAAHGRRPHDDHRPHRWRTAAIGGTGFVTGLLFHPAVKGLAYARTDIGGAYRWDAAKARWTPLTDHIGWDDWNLLGIEAMAVDPAHPDRLYLACGTYAQSWASPGAVLRSDDRGATWKRADLTVRLGANEDGRGAGERLLVDPRDSSTLWLGTRHDGLLRSADRGATWAPAAFPATPSPAGQGVTFLVAAGRTVYAGWGDGGGALYRTDGRGGWEEVPGRPSGSASVNVPVRAAYDARGRALYVTYADAPGPNGQSDGAVHRLDTVTGAWSDVTPVRPDAVAGDGFGYGGVAVDARRAGTLVVTTNNRWGRIDTVFRSADGGASWTSLKDTAVLDVSETPFLRWGGTPKFGWWMQAVAVDPFDSHHIVYGTGATIYGTRDLVHWAPEIRGLEESSVRFLIAPPGKGARLLSGLGDIGVMYHESLTASPSRGMAADPVFGTATGLALASLKPSYVVRTGWPSGSDAAGAYSEDGGRSWRPFASQPAIAPSAPGPIAVSADGSTLLWSFVHWDGTKYPAHRSTDGGRTWAEVAGFPKGGTPVADPLDPRRFYVYDTDTGAVFLSRDGGATFVRGAAGLPSGDAQFKVAAAPGRTGDLWLSAKDNGLFRSTDGGRTFAAVPGCQASHALGFGKAAPVRGRRRPGAGYPAVFQTGRVSATYDGVAVLRSDDSGRTWVRINDDSHQWGWTGEVITGDPRVHGRVYLGTNGRGIQYADPR